MIYHDRHLQQSRFAEFYKHHYIRDIEDAEKYLCVFEKE